MYPMHFLENCCFRVTSGNVQRLLLVNWLRNFPGSTQGSMENTIKSRSPDCKAWALVLWAISQKIRDFFFLLLLPFFLFLGDISNAPGTTLRKLLAVLKEPSEMLGIKLGSAAWKYTPAVLSLLLWLEIFFDYY